MLGPRVSLPGGFRQDNLRLSDLSSKVSPKIVPVEDSGLLDTCVPGRNKTKHCHVGTQLSAGHQSSGSRGWGKRGRKDAKIPSWVGGLTVTDQGSENLGVVPQAPLLCLRVSGRAS